MKWGKETALGGEARRITAGRFRAVNGEISAGGLSRATGIFGVREDSLSHHSYSSYPSYSGVFRVSGWEEWEEEES
jgi:hypothetical protein